MFREKHYDCLHENDLRTVRQELESTVADERVNPPGEGVKGELSQGRWRRDLTRWHNRAGRFLVSSGQTLSKKLGPHGALILILLAGALIAAGLTSVFALVYGSVTESDGVAGLDQPVLTAGKSIRSPGLDAVVTAYTHIGGGTGLRVLALIAIVVLGLRWRSWTPVILILTAGAGAQLMVTAGKQLIGRARPPLTDAVPPYEYTAAFPSGHALGSVVIAGVIAYLIILRLTASRSRVLTVGLAVAFAATMGLSRVYLGHHWLTDILAAWALGLAWLALVITAHRLYLTVRKTRRVLTPAAMPPEGPAR